MPDQRNLLIAIALSLAVLLVYQFAFEMPRMKEQAAREQARAEQLRQEQEARQAAEGAAGSGGSGASARNGAGDGGIDDGIVPDAPYAPEKSGGGGLVPGSGRLAEPLLNAVGPDARSGLDKQIDEGTRVVIDTPRIRGSILLRGALFDDLLLTDYRETIEPDSDKIHMLAPRYARKPYYAYFGWRADDQNLTLPNSTTPWQQRGSGDLTVDSPVVLEWENGQGLRFERTIAIDSDFMFTVTDRVTNETGAPVDLSPFGVIERRYLPPTTGFFILHEGLLGVFDETLTEVDYDELLDDDQGEMVQRTTGGWLGFTDKYWLAALIPDQTSPFTGTFRHDLRGTGDRFSSYFTMAPSTLADGGSTEISNRLFAGAKEVNLLDAYSEDLGIDRFDLAIDFGWFYFMTKPIFLVLVFFHGLFGNFGLGILLLTVLIKAAMFPLANKSYKSMAVMRRLQPEMLKLRERYADDKMKLNQEMMGLYKREKVNPLSGCLPILVQIPVFFALYKVLFVTIEMRHAPFFGWINDLSAPDPTTIFNLFGVIPWDPPSFLYLGAWPIVMGITMFVQQKLNPQPTDPIQAKIFMFLPIIFTVLLAQFAAGLVIYWAWNNFLSIVQQYVIMRRMGVKVGWGTTQAPS